MSVKSASTRRSFLKKGALLAVPLAAAAPAAVIANDDLKARLARLEDEAAIRELHQSWLRQINTDTADAIAPRFADFDSGTSGRTVRSIAADHAGEPDAIEISSDRRIATGRFHCVVEIEATIAKDSTLAQMAHAQGSGFVLRTERRVLRVKYARPSGTWSIATAALGTA